jgi:hypothetical protein
MTGLRGYSNKQKRFTKAGNFWISSVSINMELVRLDTGSVEFSSVCELQYLKIVRHNTKRSRCRHVCFDAQKAHQAIFRLVIDLCVNFVDVCIVIFGIYIFNSSIFETPDDG